MYSVRDNRSVFSSKVRIFLFPLFLAMFALQIPCLEAGGWGKTEEVTKYEGTTWNGVFFDMNGLHFTACVPNYDGALLQNGLVSVKGYIGEDVGYVINTSFNAGYKVPKSVKEFVKVVQEANPTDRVVVIDPKKFGAKYVVDIIPTNQQDKAFWRFLCTNDRLIKMGTDDLNGNRRLHFFESIYIH